MTGGGGRRPRRWCLSSAPLLLPAVLLVASLLVVDNVQAQGVNATANSTCSVQLSPLAGSAGSRISLQLVGNCSFDVLEIVNITFLVPTASFSQTRGVSQLNVANRTLAVTLLNTAFNTSQLADVRLDLRNGSFLSPASFRILPGKEFVARSDFKLFSFPYPYMNAVA